MTEADKLAISSNDDLEIGPLLERAIESLTLDQTEKVLALMVASIDWGQRHAG